MNRPLFLFFLSALALCGGTTANAQLLQSRFVTSAYAWQQADSAGAAQTHVFGFQSVQLTLGSEKFTFRTYLQGFNDFAGPNKNDAHLRVYNFSAKFRDIFSMADIQAGRFFIFSGAGRGLIDGAMLTVRPGVYDMNVSGYFGLLSPSDRGPSLGSGEDDMMGFQVSGAPVEGLHVLAGYSRKEMSQSAYSALRSDTVGTFLLDFNPSSRLEEIVTGEARYDLTGYGDVFVRYDYDIALGSTSRFNTFGRYIVMDDLAVTAEYLQREPRVSYQSIFSVFSYSTIKDVSAGVEYGITQGWRALANVGSASYGDESITRMTIGVNGEFVSASISKNISDRQNLDAFSLSGGYPLLDRLVTPTLLISYAHFKPNPSTPLRYAIGAAIGAVVRPMSPLVVDVQAQWMNNRVYQSDVRLFLRVSYQMSNRLNLF